MYLFSEVAARWPSSASVPPRDRLKDFQAKLRSQLNCLFPSLSRDTMFSDFPDCRSEHDHLSLTGRSFLYLQHPLCLPGALQQLNQRTYRGGLYPSSHLTAACSLTTTCLTPRLKNSLEMVLHFCRASPVYWPLKAPMHTLCISLQGLRPLKDPVFVVFEGESFRDLVNSVSHWNISWLHHQMFYP